MDELIEQILEISEDCQGKLHELKACVGERVAKRVEVLIRVHSWFNADMREELKHD